MAVLHVAGALFHQIGGGQVGNVQLDGQRVAVVGIADGKTAAPHRVVKAAHVPADGHRLGGFQPHEMLNEVDALFAVPVGQLVSHLIVGDFLPLAGGVVFHVAGADLVKVRLAQVMQQPADGVAFRVFAFGEKVLHHGMVDVDAVHHQAVFAGTVKTGGGRRRKEIRGFQPVQQTVGTGAGDIFIVDLHKLSVVVFHKNLTVPYR